MKSLRVIDKDMDDVDDIRDIGLEYLESFEFSIDIVNSIAEAQKLISENDYNVVVADLFISPWTDNRGTPVLNEDGSCSIPGITGQKLDDIISKTQSTADLVTYCKKRKKIIPFIFIHNYRSGLDTTTRKAYSNLPNTAGIISAFDSDKNTDQLSAYLEAIIDGQDFTTPNSWWQFWK